MSADVDVTSSATLSAATDGAPGFPLRRELIEMLVKGDGSSGSLKQLLSFAPLSDEQHALVDLFLSVGADESEPASTTASPTRSAADGEARDAHPVSDHVSDRVSELMREVADLREVNDTVAAALGACSACWGGDPSCPSCAGRGRAGSRHPDPALFRELVVPAIRRFRNQEREGARAGFSRQGSDSFRQRRSYE
jgi:hypothetical protein